MPWDPSYDPKCVEHQPGENSYNEKLLGNRAVEHEVVAIVNERIHRGKGSKRPTKQYRVQWHPDTLRPEDDEFDWIDEEDLNCPEHLEVYLRSKNRLPKGGQPVQAVQIRSRTPHKGLIVEDCTATWRRMKNLSDEQRTQAHKIAAPYMKDICHDVIAWNGDHITGTTYENATGEDKEEVISVLEATSGQQNLPIVDGWTAVAVVMAREPSVGKVAPNARRDATEAQQAVPTAAAEENHQRSSEGDDLNQEHSSEGEDSDAESDPVPQSSCEEATIRCVAPNGVTYARLTSINSPLSKQPKVTAALKSGTSQAN